MAVLHRSNIHLGHYIGTYVETLIETHMETHIETDNFKQTWAGYSRDEPDKVPCDPEMPFDPENAERMLNIIYRYTAKERQHNDSKTKKKHKTLVLRSRYAFFSLSFSFP